MLELLKNLKKKNPKASELDFLVNKILSFNAMSTDHGI